MNIYQLRNRMRLLNWRSYNGGLTSFFYTIGSNNCSFSLNNEQLTSELIAIGSIDESWTPKERLAYQLSQWDALNIAIRFEAAKEQEKDLDNSDIFKAIANIIKPK